MLAPSKFPITNVLLKQRQGMNSHRPHNVSSQFGFAPTQANQSAPRAQATR
jgi:hypothetical protein